jgi:hypothetical protein
MLEEARETDGRTLVFTQFAEMVELLKTYLREYFCEEVFLIHGGVARKKRDEMIARFQEDARAPPRLRDLAEGRGSGINLTRADRVIQLRSGWNRRSRTRPRTGPYRIGQTKNVQVFKFLVAGTLEEKIDRMIERKSAVAESVVGAGENWITEAFGRRAARRRPAGDGGRRGNEPGFLAERRILYARSADRGFRGASRRRTHAGRSRRTGGGGAGSRRSELPHRRSVAAGTELRAIGNR